MEKIGNPWCFWECHPQLFLFLVENIWSPALNEFVLALLVLTPDFDNEMTLI